MLLFFWLLAVLLSQASLCFGGLLLSPQLPGRHPSKAWGRPSPPLPRHAPRRLGTTMSPLLRPERGICEQSWHLSLLMRSPLCWLPPWCGLAMWASCPRKLCLQHFQAKPSPLLQRSAGHTPRIAGSHKEAVRVCAPSPLASFVLFSCGLAPARVFLSATLPSFLCLRFWPLSVASRPPRSFSAPPWLRFLPP
jgi:hypothetical protein